MRVAGPDGYRLETRDVSVDLKQRKLASAGPVSGQMRLGQFQAGQLRADLGRASQSAESFLLGLIEPEERSA